MTKAIVSNQGETMGMELSNIEWIDECLTHRVDYKKYNHVTQVLVGKDEPLEKIIEHLEKTIPSIEKHTFRIYSYRDDVNAFDVRMFYKN